MNKQKPAKKKTKTCHYLPDQEYLANRFFYCGKKTFSRLSVSVCQRPRNVQYDPLQGSEPGDVLIGYILDERLGLMKSNGR